MNSSDLRRSQWGDAACALALAALLCAAWTWRDWGSLSALVLPDTDDMMRLQQIRDWLGGQRFADLSQHRLGAPPGLAMHWSRLPDLVPGAIIAALTPIVGGHGAELAAVILWPALLFFAALFLTARIARELGGAAIARTAAVVAAVAYPTTTLFVPGRIDHHGFQIVLLLVIVRALVAKAGMQPGLVAGLAAAASLVIGVETAPLIAAAFVAVGIVWLRVMPGSGERMLGLGTGLVAGLLAAAVLLRPELWRFPGCDGFTLAAWRAGVIGGAAAIAMSLAGHKLTKLAPRLLIAAVTLAVAGIAIALVAPQCLSPYGLIDPALAKLWLGKVGEAQPLFEAPATIAISYSGLMIVGIAASAWRAQITRDPRWLMLLAVQVAALLLTLMQVRGAYAGAILAAPALAATIAAARVRGVLWLAGAWLMSAGMIYPLAAEAVVPQAQSAGPGVAGSCMDGAALAELNALPPGRLLAPLDLGAYAIGATRLSVVGAPYHRNNRGNLAVFRAFLASPEAAQAIVQAWDVRYVATCPGQFGDARKGSLADALLAGPPPLWLTRIPTRNPALMLYRVNPGLFPGQRAVRAADAGAHQV